MPQTLDVTGLPPEAVRAIKSLITMLRSSTPQAPAPVSVFDLIGKAPRQRTGEDIARQIEEERNSWGES